MNGVLRFLRSPRLALGVIGFLAVWTGVGAWAPWMQPQGPAAPAWAVATGLSHPFTSLPFLAGIALLFAATLACTWGKRARVVAIRRGEMPGSAVRLLPRNADLDAFLSSEGFRGNGVIRTRFAFALWGGWVFHVGLLVLIAAALVQFSLHDSGTFDLSVSERASLAAHGTVFGRERGPLAREALPDVEVALARFDPFLHQHGYSQDRLSELDVFVPGQPVRTETMDRAAGIRAGDIEIFQAIPTGLSLTIDVQGLGLRAVKLQPESARRASAEVTTPSGTRVRFIVDAQNEIDRPGGEGRMLVWIEGPDGRSLVAPGAPFPFGTGTARMTAVSRWGRFTYTHTPGFALVVGGLVVVLLGSLLLSFPAGVVRVENGGGNRSAVLFVTRGGSAIAADWERVGSPTSRE